MTTLDIDPRTQKIIDAFDEHSRTRAAELLQGTELEPLQSARERAFCIGYKAGVIDLSAAQRLDALLNTAHILTVFDMASTWRDSPDVDARFLAGTCDLAEARLIAAIDAARAAMNTAKDAEKEDAP